MSEGNIYLYAVGPLEVSLAGQIVNPVSILNDFVN